MGENRFEGRVDGDLIQIGTLNGPLVLQNSQFRVRKMIASERAFSGNLRAPSALLDPRNSIIPFEGRGEELSAIHSWLDADTAISSLLIHGEGGLGKTRLASKVASDAAKNGWEVLEAEERPAIVTSLTGLGEDASHQEAAALVVVDYAERWEASAIQGLLESLCSRSQRIRVLFLSRPGYEFWKHLRRIIPLECEWMDPLALGGLYQWQNVSSLNETLTKLAEAFAAALDVSLTNDFSIRASESTRSLAKPLDMHMMALSEVCAFRDSEEVPENVNLTSYLMEHERRVWGSDPDDELEQAVISATLFGPFDAEEAAHMFVDVGLSRDTKDARALLRRHAQIYPQSEGVSTYLPLQPLRPDRFGEDFIGETLGQLSTRHLVKSLVQNVLSTTSGNVKQAITVLSASAVRFGSSAEVLVDILNDNTELIDLSDPLTVQIVSRAAPEGFKTAFVAALPTQRDARSVVAAELCQALADDAESDDDAWRRFTMLRRCAAHWSAAGEVTRSVEPTERALRMILPGQTAEQRDEAAAVRSLLLRSLAESKRESGTDPHGAASAASEAVAILRDLADRERLEDMTELVDALTELGSILSDLSGNFSDGLKVTREASEILGRIPEGDVPPITRSRVLNNLCARYLQMKNPEAAVGPARSAVHILTSVVEPSDKVRTALAAAHVNRAGAAASVGLFDEAISSAEMGLELRMALRRPTEQPTRDLARALKTAGQIFIGAGRVPEGQDLLLQAAEVFESLVDNSLLTYCEPLLEVENELRQSLAAEFDRVGPLPDEYERCQRIAANKSALSSTDQQRRFAVALIRASCDTANELGTDARKRFMSVALTGFTALVRAGDFRESCSFLECIYEGMKNGFFAPTDLPPASLIDRAVAEVVETQSAYLLAFAHSYCGLAAEFLYEVEQFGAAISFFERASAIADAIVGLGGTQQPIGLRFAVRDISRIADCNLFLHNLRGVWPLYVECRLRLERLAEIEIIDAHKDLRGDAYLRWEIAFQSLRLVRADPLGPVVDLDVLCADLLKAVDEVEVLPDLLRPDALIESLRVVCLLCGEGRALTPEFGVDVGLRAIRFGRNLSDDNDAEAANAVAKARGAVGTALAASGRFTEAIPHFEASVRELVALHETGVADTAVNCATGLVALAQSEEALGIFPDGFCPAASSASHLAAELEQGSNVKIALDQCLSFAGMI